MSGHIEDMAAMIETSYYQGHRAESLLDEAGHTMMQERGGGVVYR